MMPGEVTGGMERVGVRKMSGRFVDWNVFCMFMGLFSDDGLRCLFMQVALWMPVEEKAGL